jgi:hypothetical protein
LRDYYVSLISSRDKLKEELQIMWYKVRLLYMPRQRLPKLREYNKLIHLKKERKKEME